ncbi:hypothetical protein Dimus_014657 [Dionaea muscipula]
MACRGVLEWTLCNAQIVLENNSMAAVFKAWENLQKRSPATILTKCHEIKDSLLLVINVSCCWWSQNLIVGFQGVDFVYNRDAGFGFSCSGNHVNIAVFEDGLVLPCCLYSEHTDYVINSV